MNQRFLRLAPYVVRQRGWFAAIVAMSLALSTTAMLQPWPMKVLVDDGLKLGRVASAADGTDAGWWSDQSPAVLIGGAAVATLLLFVVNAALDAALSWSWMAAGQRMVYDLAADVYERLLRLPLAYHRRSHVGDSLERLSGDAWSVYGLASAALVTPLQQGVVLIGVGWASWQLHPRLAALALTAAPAVALSVRYFGPRLKRRAKQGREVRSELSSFIQQTIAAMPLVQAFGAEQRNQDRYESLADRVVTTSQRGVLINKSFLLVNGLANETARGAVLCYGGTLALRGELSPGTLLVFLAYVRTLQSACTRLLEAYAKLRTIEASVDRLCEIFDVPLPTEPSEPTASCRSTNSPRRDDAAIRFENVTVEYVPGRRALDGVSLAIAPGQKVALVGASGSGKSTLAALIPRLIEPTQGRVTFAGADVRDFTLDDLRSEVALLTQDPFILPITVAENIALGRPDATRSDIIDAAMAAQAHEFIERLPHGYDSVIGQRGATLSGGQKQRLAIARALVRDAPIVILDEPASALDHTTEHALAASFARVLGGRTSLVISHRLETLRDADQIVVLGHGRVLEVGSHDELLLRGEHYYALCRAQLPHLCEAAV
jgi:ATP-binding cassette subfamily B protein